MVECGGGVVYCDCAVGSACPVAGSNCTCCSVAGAITGFGASGVELEKGHMVVMGVYVRLERMRSWLR